MIKKVYHRIADLYHKIELFVFLTLIQRNGGTIIMKGKLIIVGLPIIILKKNSKVIFGDSVALNSKAKQNMVGLIKKCTIYAEENAVVSIGDGSGLSGVSIYANKGVYIGKYIACGGNVFIWDTDFHSINYLERRTNQNKIAIHSKEITIGDDVFIGANSIILKGVSIGDRAVIGAGSVVTKNIGSDEIWGGNPAAFIKKISYE